ncbi:hypothetical protein N0V93_005292 [Gnomoniopsis smithogilvyi]|uniref:Bola-like protein n=1 Tax=Gnomoniopsis smithogilvyi TaxID=1191159 RepID=A0A9W8YUG7_9PEZI|nr:hypothetical protein N0V93_005292 [Gnomoniopsis smithogilvyi]
MTKTTNVPRISKQSSTSFPKLTATSTLRKQLVNFIQRSQYALPEVLQPFQGDYTSGDKNTALQKSRVIQIQTPMARGRPSYSSTTATLPTPSHTDLVASAAAESPSPATAKALEKPDFLDEAESVIWDRLVKEFSPVELVVQDISGGCGSMYGIEISSEKFRGANMLKQQRMVNAVLGDLLKDWHGCQLKTRVP